MSQPGSGTRKRIRLKPEVRSQLILDAALAEFSLHGFAASRIEDIAARAGLSKSGVYAHYAGKAEIFEALLDDAIAPPADATPAWSPAFGSSLEGIVDSYLEQLYEKMLKPRVLAIFRLLLAEGERVPELVQRWHDRVVRAHWTHEQAVIDDCIVRGIVRPSMFAAHFPAFAHAPAVQWMIANAVFREGEAPMTMEQTRAVHRGMLLDLLRPQP